jgi:hypothetical protein
MSTEGEAAIQSREAIIRARLLSPIGEPTPAFWLDRPTLRLDRAGVLAAARLIGRRDDGA